MKKTISIRMGKGFLEHNRRHSISNNIDSARTHLNIKLADMDIEAAYHKLFDESVNRYNADPRHKNKITNYYQQIKNSKLHRTFYEIIVQIGNCKDTPATGKDAPLAAKILEEFYHGFQKNNQTLYIICAYIHMDEATPHLHIDFIPYTQKSTRGMDTRVSLRQALAELGYTGGDKEVTEWNMFIDGEKERLANIMESHNITVIHKNEKKQHLSILSFKIKKMQEEIEELTKKSEQLKIANEQKLSEYKKIANQIDAAESELNKLKNAADTINMNAKRYTEPDWCLPAPGAFVKASAYYRIFAAPLIAKYQNEIKKLITQCLEKDALIHNLTRTDSLNAKIASAMQTEIDTLRNDARMLRKLLNYYGEKEINMVLKKAEKESEHTYNRAIK